jgi:maleate isomerase
MEVDGMADALGYRLKAGVLAPSTNTVVEPDYYAMGPYGTTFHIGRIYIEDANLSSNAAFEHLLDQIRAAIHRALDDVMTCKPDAIIMGMSAETFWGGKAGNAEFTRRMSEWSGGLRVYTGADACDHALKIYGARRIGVVTPYQPVGDEQVRKFFADCGYEVVNLVGLKCKTAVDIAHQSEAVLARAIREVNGPDVDAIVQVGTNLSMVRLADAAERFLEKPVIAINAATLWHALRSEGIKDQKDGYGGLFREC